MLMMAARTTRGERQLERQKGGRETAERDEEKRENAPMKPTKMMNVW